MSAGSPGENGEEEYREALLLQLSEELLQHYHEQLHCSSC